MPLMQKSWTYAATGVVQGSAYFASLSFTL